MIEPWNRGSRFTVSFRFIRLYILKRNKKVYILIYLILYFLFFNFKLNVNYHKIIFKFLIKLILRFSLFHYIILEKYRSLYIKQNKKFIF